MKKSEINALLANWKSIANFVYTEAATEEVLKALIDTERASDAPRASIMTLLYQRYSTHRRERELKELWEKIDA
jgi:arginine/lysine/ornithine decarboxylase